MFLAAKAVGKKGQRQCLQPRRQWNTQSKGAVLCLRHDGRGMHKAKAVSYRSSSESETTSPCSSAPADDGAG